MNKSKPKYKSRSWNKKIKSKKWCLHDVNVKGVYYKNFWSSSLPQSDNAVINKIDSNSWQGRSQKIKNYFHTKNQTCTLVDLPPSKKNHTTTWVCKVNVHVNNIITKLKACLVTSNFQQRIINNFDEMFLLMVKCNMFHTITTLIVHNRWPIYHFNVLFFK
jgi:hypothetical protein